MQGDSAPDYYALWIEHLPNYWPILGLLLVVVLLWRWPDFLGRLTEVEVFGVSLKLTQGVAKIEEAINSSESRITALEREIEALRAAQPAEDRAGPAAEPDPATLAERIVDRVHRSEFTHRSIDRLAAEIGVSVAAIERAIASMPHRFQRSHSDKLNKPVVRLKH